MRVTCKILMSIESEVRGNYVVWHERSVMKPFSTEQKTQIVKFYLKHGSAVLTQRRYRSHFKVRKAPTIKTIQRLTEKFLAEGSTDNKNSGKSGRKKNIPQSGGHPKGRGAGRPDPESVGEAPCVTGWAQQVLHSQDS